MPLQNSPIELRYRYVPPKGLQLEALKLLHTYKGKWKKTNKAVDGSQTAESLARVKTTLTITFSADKTKEWVDGIVSEIKNFAQECAEDGSVGFSRDEERNSFTVQMDRPTKLNYDKVMKELFESKKRA